MPAAGIQKKEKKAHFVKVSGKETAATRAATEVLRGVDPLVVWPRKVTSFDWLKDACAQVFDHQEVEGRQVEGIRYSSLELVLGPLIRIGDACKRWVFKDTMFAPEFLAEVSRALLDDERFDVSSERLSVAELAREVSDFASGVLRREDKTFDADREECFLKLVPQR